MTEDNSLPQPVDPPLSFEETAAVSNGRRARGLAWIGLIVILLLGGGTFVWQVYGDRLSEWFTRTASVDMANDSGESLAGRVRTVENALGGLDRKVEVLDGRVNDLNDHLLHNGGGTVVPTEVEVKALRDRLAALEKVVAGLADQAAGKVGDKAPSQAHQAPAQGGSLDAADVERLVQLEQGLADLKARQNQNASVDALAKLEDTLSALTEAQDKQTATVTADVDRMEGAAHGISLVYALGRLRATVEAGRPYGRSFAIVNRQARALGLDKDGPDKDGTVAEALKGLASHAATGVSSLDVLVAGFDAAAKRAMEVDAMPEDAGFLDRLGAEARSLVTIRSVGKVTGDGTSARIARAEVDLSQGSLDLAIKELDGLGDKPKAALAPWLDQAKARRSALGALDTLDGHVAERFTGAE